MGRYKGWIARVAIGLTTGGFWWFRWSAAHTVSGGLLGRPLRIGIVSWPGYAGGIVANAGFKANKGSSFWHRQNLLVEFVLLEDVDTRAKAFSRGGKGGVDIIWSTVDFWAQELPGFQKNGIHARAVMQVDWSRGADAIVADRSIRRIEDLTDKRISLALFTPSHWLLESALEASSLNGVEQSRIVKALIGKNVSPDARSDFVAGKVDAAVVWEPDVTEALRKRPNSHILLSTEKARELIADLMVAREDFIRQHRRVIMAFIRGWLEGVDEANRDPQQAARLLMDNEPMYKNLGEEATLDGLRKIKLADLADNIQMFGLRDHEQPVFDRIFERAAQAWIKRGYLTHAAPVAQAKDDSFLREIVARGH
jgi:NitT/TauT family transport system substrate-binding protein